jgi:prepilin-type N-terminal cleavage/methylation domain-containing protein
VQTSRQKSAFTLLELLAVIAIIGILAAITLPTLNSFKTNNLAAGTRQLLDDLARARQLAMSQRTTVFMIFVPQNFWSTPFYGSLTQDQKDQADKLLEKQLNGYCLMSLRSLGDQPGRPTPRRLSQWKSLPDGVIIPLLKFGAWNPALPPLMNVDTNQDSYPDFKIYGFQSTNLFPVLLESTSSTGLEVPYIAFNYMGQLVNAADLPTQRDELIPLAEGRAFVGRDPNTKVPTRTLPTFTESPPGNATNSLSYNLVKVDWLTGRARVERREVQ